MKKVLALLVVLAVIAIPAMAFASVSTDGLKDSDFKFDGAVSNMQSDFYMFPEAVTGEADVELPPIVVIPAAGAVALAGVATVLATLGCALIPKK